MTLRDVLFLIALNANVVINKNGYDGNELSKTKVSIEYNGDLDRYVYGIEPIDEYTIRIVL